MARGAAKQPSLLYVANQGSSDVTVYTYSDGGGLILVGTLTGFSRLGGMCTDKNGDVWIPDAYTRRVYRYAHGATKPAGIIREVGSSEPYDCSVDPNTGNVAVANHGEFGNVRIYPKGQRTGTKHEIRRHVEPDYVAYDDKGNIFVDCEIAYTNRVSLYEFPNGGDRFVHIALNGNPLNEPGALQWIKPTLLVGDQAIDGQTSLAHKVFISGSTATIVGQITFPETQHASAFWRRGDKIVVPDAAADAVEIYTFPGGALFATLTTQVSRPSGAVISQAGQDR